MSLDLTVYSLNAPTKKKIGAVMWALLTALVVLCSCLVYGNHDEWKEIDENWVYDIPSGMRVWIDYVKQEEDTFIIEGYAFVHGENLNVVNSQIIILDETDNKFYSVDTSVCNRGDLSEYFDEGFSYDEGRFFARVFRKHLNREHQYSVHILYKCNGYNTLLDTGRRLFEDEQ